MLYFIQVSLSWFGFYALYQLLYKQETFFKLNRFYLLFTLLLGCLMPLNWSILNPISNESVSNYVVYIQPFVVGVKTANTQIVESTLNLKYWFTTIYIIGSSCFALRFIWGITQIALLIYKGEKVLKDNFTFVKLSGLTAPFSFGKWIFVNAELLESIEGQMIIAHEKAHIQQKHSWDILFLEILKILFWCSPMIYLYEKSIKTIHEYLADEAVIQKNTKKEYATLLLKQATTGQTPAYVHHFHSQLKTRFAMLIKTSSSRWAYSKYTFFIPIALIFSILINSENSNAQTALKEDFYIERLADTVVTFDPNTHEEKITYVTAIDTIYKITDEVAQFKGGQSALFKFLADNIKYPQEDKDKGIEGKVVISFRINQEGYVNSAKVKKSSNSQSLDKEAIRVIELMRQYSCENRNQEAYWLPGKKNGKAVTTDFVLPIMFKLEEKDKKAAPDKQ